MPLVRAVISRSYEASKLVASDLGYALSEIVPAALNSEQGELTPGSIEFMVRRAHDGDRLTVDVFVEVEAFHYDDRDENLQERTTLIQEGLKEMFPSLTFAVWCKLVNAGWASDSTDPEFDGDMSIGAALNRVADTLGL